MLLQANPGPKRPAYWHVLIEIVRDAETHHTIVGSVHVKYFTYPMGIGAGRTHHLLAAWLFDNRAVHLVDRPGQLKRLEGSLDHCRWALPALFCLRACNTPGMATGPT
jgi:hypothetical protein